MIKVFVVTDGATFGSACDSPLQTIPYPSRPRAQPMRKVSASAQVILLVVYLLQRMLVQFGLQHIVEKSQEGLAGEVLKFMTI